MSFNLGTTAVQDTVRHVCAYLDSVTGCSAALEQQTREPGLHERQTSLTLFHARSVPTIDLDTYISRILKYCPCPNEVFLGLIVYMQQMIDQCARRRMPFTVDAYSIHRLVITAVTVGSKWFSDVFFTNSRYAKVGGLSVAELNNLELQFLSIVDFDLNIQPEVLQAIGSDLFAGRLPRLSNVHVSANAGLSHIPPPLQSAFSPLAEPPAAAYGYHHQSRTAPCSARPMSYPGPSGVFYSNPHAIEQSVGKYEGLSAHDKHRQQPSVASALMANSQSTEKTLTSSSPGDTTAISALSHGVV
ncbi:cyclin-like protein interacting with PHO85 [Coemansia sp. Benny D115]|nr:cyclin-like protein interacting with PHO85 [Coemansia sp. Benny D115]